MARIRKIKVTDGVFWVEAPEAGLHVLCGCPADVVKHLMKRGLIVPTESQGVAFETGPNAILLGDVMLQNGVFANLAEFPVLQMFYRQGMIIPGHPGNTGRKPILMGLREQVESQLQYIYRGNYGLVSEQEIEATGVDPATARDMMRLKLRFAFGRIHHPGDLIDTLFLGGEPVEVMGGVTVRRTSFNVYTFALGEERVAVDLNLGPFETYECPYPLGNHEVRLEYFAVIHTGEGDGWDFNRPSMGSLLVFQGKFYLVDAGPHIQASLQALGIGLNEIEGIFHTHSHDDHFAGLTALIRSDHRVKYYATPLVRHSVAKKLAALLDIEETTFGDYFDVHDLAIDQWNDIEGLEVKPVFSPHPVETTIFLFRTLWVGGYRSYAHFADMVSLDVLESMVTDDPSAPGLDRAWFERIRESYAERSDIKKLDIGGGLIHGVAKDFRDDLSGKIILAHTARRLTEEERRIGSGAPFGTIDVLVPGNTDFTRRLAHEALAAYFPDVPRHGLRLLLNAPLATFNPETILIREGQPHDDVFLILGGSVERLTSNQRGMGLLFFGSLAGEGSALRETVAGATYRAVGFVQALRIPGELYRGFVERHDLLADLLMTQENRLFLRGSWLFGDGVSGVVLNGLVHALQGLSVEAGEAIDIAGSGNLFMVKCGSVNRQLGDEVLEILKSGDFFGEEQAVFGTPTIFHFVATERSDLFLVPGSRLADIPALRWKLLETLKRRTRAVVDDNGSRRIAWHHEYGVNIQAVDIHHKRLFEVTAALADALAAGQDHAKVLATLDFLVDYAHYHFEQEEDLMRCYGYPEVDDHRASHRRLLGQMDGLRARLMGGANADDPEFQEFLKTWIANHIQAEDRKYAGFLNAKGVY
ncbi:MAG: bacteriohemerythrin [Magnetospirillum sp. WYHS-4]